MLVKVIFLDLPLWHRILVLEILRVILMLQHVHFSYFVYEIFSSLSIFLYIFFPDNQNLWNLTGFLCGGTDFAGSFPEL